MFSAWHICWGLTFVFFPPYWSIKNILRKGQNWVDLLDSKPEWKHLIQHEGLSTLDPAAAQSSNASPAPLACVWVRVFGGWVLREHLDKSLVLCFLVQMAPWEETPACTCRFSLWIIRIFTSAAYTHSSHISHTSRTPLAEDTHTETHRQAISFGLGEILNPH